MGLAALSVSIHHGQGNEGCRRRTRRASASQEGDEGQGHEGEEGQGHEGHEGRQEEVKCRAACVPAMRAAMTTSSPFLYNNRSVVSASGCVCFCSTASKDKK